MEPIKQEIVNNIYENGEQLITGPVLQEVLVDMVDDYNEKISSGSLPSDLIEKTGSWDSASAWVEDNKDDLVHTGDLDGYATEQWVGEQGYLTEHQDISGLATTQSVNQLSESVAESIADIPVVDLSGYATTASVNEATESVKEWVEEKNYATETFVSESIAGIDIPDVSEYLPTASFNLVSASFDERINAITGSDLSGYATTESLNSVSQSISQSINSLADTVNDKAEARDLTSLSESVANDFANLPEVDLSEYLTTASYSVDSASFDERINSARSEASGAIRETYLLNSSSIVSLSSSVADDLANLDIPDVSIYATTASLNSLSESIADTDDNFQRVVNALEGAGNIVWDDIESTWSSPTMATAQELGELSESVANDFANLDISGLATTASVNQLSSSVSSDIQNARTEVSAGFASVDQGIRVLSASFDQRINDITGSSVDLSGYLTTASFNQASESIDERLSNHQEAIEALEGAGTLYWDEDHWSATDKVDRQEFDEVSASFDQRIDAIVPPDLSIYATTASVDQVSESLSQSIAAITASGADTELRNFLFGTVTSSISSLDCSVTYLYCSQSSNATLGFSTVPEDGHSIAVDIFNVSTGSIDIFIPGTSNGYSITTNGIDYIVPYTWTIPGRQHGNLVIIRKNTDLFLRTSVDISGSGGSGTDTELRNFLFGTGTQDITSITSSIANIGATVSSDSTLGFNTVPENGESIGITIYNTSANSASIILPETVEVDNVTYNLINNGVDGSGSMAIPAGEYGDIVVTRIGSDLYIRTSIDVSNISVDLSGYATTSSLNTVSQSLSASNAVTLAAGMLLSSSVASDFENLSNREVEGNKVGQFMESLGLNYWDDGEGHWSTYLDNAELLNQISNTGLVIPAQDDTPAEWREAATSESLASVSQSISSRIDNLVISGSTVTIVTTLTSASTDAEVPSARCMYNLVGNYTTETWTFILEDSSSVTKNIVVA